MNILKSEKQHPARQEMSLECIIQVSESLVYMCICNVHTCTCMYMYINNYNYIYVNCLPHHITIMDQMCVALQPLLIINDCYLVLILVI